ncbi:hypothetical protein AB0M43_30695 [Longispora sp. NPDC051575]|uniref:hypothetical protein n=1 Tax=Longispora sp. NPDC051575 TaxID=3154943 RepID=UPI0034477C7A
MTDLWPDEKKPYYPGGATALGLSLLLMCPVSGWALYVLDSRGQLKGGEIINGVTALVCVVPAVLLITNAILRLCFTQGQRRGWPALVAIGAGVGACLVLAGALALGASMIDNQ